MAFGATPTPPVCVFPVWVPLRPPVGRFVRPSVWWSAFVRPFVWVVPPPPVGRFLFRVPATFILCHLSVVRRLCYGALAPPPLLISPHLTLFVSFHRRRCSLSGATPTASQRPITRRDRPALLETTAREFKYMNFVCTLIYIYLFISSIYIYIYVYMYIYISSQRPITRRARPALLETTARESKYMHFVCTLIYIYLFISSIYIYIYVYMYIYIYPHNGRSLGAIGPLCAGRQLVRLYIDKDISIYK